MKKFDKEQNFVFKLEMTIYKKHTDYDEAMKQIIDEVNQLNDGEVVIDKIGGSHTILSI